jgi:hypothetical protein
VASTLNKQMPACPALLPVPQHERPVKTTSEVLRVASVPESHVYVRHIGVPGDGVVRLDDPPPDAAAPEGVWWPPSMLAPDWIQRNAHEFDVFHLHFGFDAKTPEDLADVVGALREAGKPFLYTVHDLRNPHHRDPRLHDEQLDVLVPAADELVTLTPGAAAEIHERWGRSATVVPHPFVVDEPWRSARRTARDEFVVGVHAKSLRANMNPGPVIDALRRILEPMSGTRLRVDVHTDVFAPGSANHDPELVTSLEAAACEGAIDLRVHDCFSDAALWRYFLDLDVSVLPYRFGTHSGWLEACHDLGTTVIAPEVGYFASQRPCFTYRVDERGPEYTSLEQALRSARDSPSRRADPAERDREREVIARVHKGLYDRLLATSSGGRRR